MDKTIEKTFFKAFELGGVVNACISYFQQKYDLGYYPQGDEELPPEWKEHFYTKLPEFILKETETFYNNRREYESPLIDEIEQNLKECTTIQEQDRYLFSLLTPFKRYSDIFHPTATINRLKNNIEKTKQDKEFWASSNENDKDKQIEACNWFIEQREKEIERTYYINSQFIKITCGQINEKNTVENCLYIFVSAVSNFANRLDALLLTYGIDLMRLQKESGIYLKNYRCITDVDWYIGSMELAQKYIDELPKLNDDSTANDFGNNYSTTTNTTLQPPHIDDCTDEELTATTNSDKKETTTILTERLKSYFNAQFKGMGNNENYFDNNLIPDLQLPMTGREIATVALIIYESRKMINKPNSFNSWYFEFCQIMGTKKLTYKPSSLNPATMRRRFYYL